MFNRKRGDSSVSQEPKLIETDRRSAMAQDHLTAAWRVSLNRESGYEDHTEDIWGKKLFLRLLLLLLLRYYQINLSEWLYLRCLIWTAACFAHAEYWIVAS